MRKLQQEHEIVGAYRSYHTATGMRYMFHRLMRVERKQLNTKGSGESVALLL